MNSTRQALPLALCFLFLAACGQKPDPDSSPRQPTAAEKLRRENRGLVHPDGRFYRKPREFVPGPELAGKSHNDPLYILAWNRSSTVEDYRRIGKKNPAWDTLAEDALDEFAKVISQSQAGKLSDAEWENLRGRVGEAAQKAIDAGCDDPLVRYVHAHYVTAANTNSTTQVIMEAYGAAADALAASEYHSLRKAYALWRASEAFTNHHPREERVPARNVFFIRGSINCLCEGLFDTAMPPTLAASTAKSIFDAYEGSPSTHADFYKSLLPTLERNWRDHAFAHHLIGRIHVAKAWDARGSGFADTVTEQGWKGFNEHLEKANLYLRRAWVMNTNDAAIPNEMLTIATGFNFARPEMEIWFERAMRIDTNNYQAVWSKSWYLQPRWHGDEDDALEFAREVVANPKWGGETPLVLPRLHASLRAYYNIDPKKYYSDPAVWADIQSAYKKFFGQNPDADAHRHDYARDAYRCGQYQLFLDQLARFKGRTNFAFFGGQTNFNGMIQHALAQVSQPK